MSVPEQPNHTPPSGPQPGVPQPSHVHPAPTGGPAAGAFAPPTGDPADRAFAAPAAGPAPAVATRPTTDSRRVLLAALVGAVATLLVWVVAGLITYGARGLGFMGTHLGGSAVITFGGPVRVGALLALLVVPLVAAGLIALAVRGVGHRQGRFALFLAGYAIAMITLWLANGVQALEVVLDFLSRGLGLPPYFMQQIFLTAPAPGLVGGWIVGIVLAAFGGARRQGD